MRLQIKNWDKYQADKRRAGGAWAKIYKRLLQDAEFMSMSESNRWRFVGLILLACDGDNGEVPYSEKDIAFNLRLRSFNAEPFIEKGLIIDLSGECAQVRADARDDVLEKRREEEIEKNINNDHFPKFWEAYPNKVAKGRARTAWGKLPGGTNLDTVIAGAKKQAAQYTRDKTERKFMKHPATWLNDECWANDYDEPKPKAPPKDFTGYRAFDVGEKPSDGVSVKSIVAQTSKNLGAN